MDIAQIVTLASIGLLGWSLRAIYTKLTEQLTRQDRALSTLTVKARALEVGIFGYDGDNGINGTVKELKRTVETLVRGHLD